MAIGMALEMAVGSYGGGRKHRQELSRGSRGPCGRAPWTDYIRPQWLGVALQQVLDKEKECAGR